MLSIVDTLNPVVLNIQNFQELLSEILHAISAEYTEKASCDENWSEHKQLVEGINEDNENVVYLQFADDSRHHVSKRTLTCVPDSMLRALFETWAPLQEKEGVTSDGYYFIGEDTEIAGGSVFKYILDYLRDGQLLIPLLSTTSSKNMTVHTALQSAVISDAQFYGLEPLIYCIEHPNKLNDMFIGDLVISALDNKGYLYPYYFGKLHTLNLKDGQCTVVLYDGSTHSAICGYKSVKKIDSFITEDILCLSQFDQAWYYGKIIDDSLKHRKVGRITEDSNEEDILMKRKEVVVQVGMGMFGETQEFLLKDIIGCPTKPRLQMGCFYAVSSGGNGTCFVQPTTICTGTAFHLKWNYGGLHYTGRGLLHKSHNNNILTVGCLCLGDHTLCLLQYEVNSIPSSDIMKGSVPSNNNNPNNTVHPQKDSIFIDNDDALLGGLLVGREIPVENSTLGHTVQYEALQWMGTLNTYNTTNAVHSMHKYDTAVLFDNFKKKQGQVAQHICNRIGGKYRSEAPNEDTASVTITPIEGKAYTGTLSGIYTVSWEYPQVSFLGKGCLDASGSVFSVVSAPKNIAAEFQVIVYDFEETPDQQHFTFRGEWITSHTSALDQQPEVSGPPLIEDLHYVGPL